MPAFPDLPDLAAADAASRARLGSLTVIRATLDALIRNLCETLWPIGLSLKLPVQNWPLAAMHFSDTVTLAPRLTFTVLGATWTTTRGCGLATIGLVGWSAASA